MIAWHSLAQHLDNDPEFRLAVRHWTATVRLDIGNESHAIRVADGQIAGVAASTNSAPCAVSISAPPEAWEKMLQPIPPPFYQDLFAAGAHHGVILNGDLLDVAAYYPALRRLMEILREPPEVH